MKKFKELFKDTQDTQVGKVIIGLIGGAFIGLLGARFLFLANDLISIGDILIMLISLVAFFVIGIIVHELGHLAFGLATGYNFSLFRLGSFAWFKENGKVKFTISKNFALGQCLLSPSESFADFRFILYNLGGIIAQLLLCVLLFVFTTLLSGAGIARVALLIGIIINIIIALLNLIPIKSLEAPNDGANILEALKSKEATYALYKMFDIHAKMMNGQTLRDFELHEFELSENADLDNYLIAYMLMINVAWLMSHGKYEKALTEYLRLDLEKIPNYYRDAAMMDLVYLYTVYVPDYEQARKLHDDKRLRAKWKMKFPSTLRILAAYHFFVLKDKLGAMKLLESAKEAVITLPNKGDKKMEMNELTSLEKKISVNR